MFIRTAHILIEQGLQNIGVFAYGDILHEEIDLQINKKMLALMEDAFDPLKKARHPYQDGQSILDKFQNLQVKGFNAATTLDSGGTFYTANLPSDYVHLVSDVSLVLKLDNMTPIIPGGIVAGEYYYNNGQKTITYNGLNYTNGQWFQGQTGITGYTYSGTGTLLLVKMRRYRNANRLQYEEFGDQVLNNYLTQTSYKSPVSSLSGNTLYIYRNNSFFINNAFLTYVRKPKVANYNFKKYSPTDNLTVGNAYESTDNTITYNGNTYQPFQPFTVVSGILTYSGTATVRLQGDGDIEFSDTMSYDVIDEVISDLMIITEQSQQKVVNFIQKDTD